jgi:hypothetical protein
MAAFSEAASKSFEERMLAHLRRFFPKRCAALGEGAARELVRDGIAAARSYSVVAERDVARYLDVAMALESGADLAAEHAWAREILGSAEDPGAKMDRLCAAAQSQLP